MVMARNIPLAHLNRAGDGAIAPSIQGRIFWRGWISLGAAVLPLLGAILFATLKPPLIRRKKY